MDLSELLNRPAARPSAARPRPARPFDATAAIAEIGSEVAAQLSLALERVHQMASSGRISRSGMRALRDEIEHARRVGIMAQQISRLASGRVGTTPERLDLPALLGEVLLQRRREIEARGVEVRQVLGAAEVIADATLLFSLLQTVVDWSFEHTVSRIDFTVEMRSWPAHARLRCGFAHRPADEVSSQPAPLEAESPPPLDSVSWRLIELSAAALGLVVERRDTPARTELILEFPKTVGDRLEGLVAQELDDPAALGINSRPLAGSHVLVVAARKEVRSLVREAIRSMGMMVDFVHSVEAAVAFCRDAVPHAVVHEGALGGTAFEALRRDLLAQAPAIAFVEIAEHGKAFAVHNAGGHQFASVGRDAILESLPAALMFELARTR